MPICLGCGRVLRQDELACPRCEPAAKGAPAAAKRDDDRPVSRPTSRPAQPPPAAKRRQQIGAGAFAIAAIGLLMFSLTHTRFGPPRADAIPAAATNRAPTAPAPAAPEQASTGSPPTAVSPTASATSTWTLPPLANMPVGGYEQPAPQRVPTQRFNPPPVRQQTNAWQAGNEVTIPSSIAMQQGPVAGSSPEAERSGAVVRVGAPEESVQARRPRNDDRVLRYCPFDLRPGMEIRLSLGAEPANISFQGEKAGSGGGESLAGGITCRDWTVRGVRGGALRLKVEQGGAAPARRLWVDQPFEVLKGGEVVGTFANTSEYQQALQ